MSRIYRVLVSTGKRQEGAATYEDFETVEVTRAQAHAYANGDPDWRNAVAATWYGQLWRRLTSS